MWKIGKMVEGGPTDGGRLWIPELWLADKRGVKKLVRDYPGKAKICWDTFFPLLPVESCIPKTAKYPEGSMGVQNTHR